MRIIKKISIVIMCMCAFISTNFSKAVNISPKEYVSFYTRNVYEQLYYKGEKLSIPIAMCYYGGNDYPIYALTQEKRALSKGIAYSCKLNKIISNNEVRKALILGYPNCKVEGLENISEQEWYIITQMAVLDNYYHYDLNEFTVAQPSIYSNIISHLTTFVEKVRSTNINNPIPELNIIEQNKDWQKDIETKESKTYEVVSNMNFKSYTVTLNTFEGEHIRITNENNEPQQTFAPEEKFKILLADDKEIEFEITVTTEFETNQIIQGNGQSDKWEPYVLLGDTEKIEAKLEQARYHKQDENPSKGEENTDIESNPDDVKDEENKNPEEEITNPSENEDNKYAEEDINRPNEEKPEEDINKPDQNETEQSPEESINNSEKNENDKNPEDISNVEEIENNKKPQEDSNSQEKTENKKLENDNSEKEENKKIEENTNKPNKIEENQQTKEEISIPKQNETKKEQEKNINNLNKTEKTNIKPKTLPRTGF